MGSIREDAKVSRDHQQLEPAARLQCSGPWLGTVVCRRGDAPLVTDPVPSPPVLPSGTE